MGASSLKVRSVDLELFEFLCGRQRLEAVEPDHLGLDDTVHLGCHAVILEPAVLTGHAPLEK